MKKYLNMSNGFIRFDNEFELNWSMYDWALPLTIDFSSKYLLFIRILCLSFIIPIPQKRLKNKSV